MPEPGSRYIKAWEDELPEHPVIAELRAQPGRWAVLDENAPNDYELTMALRRCPNVETNGRLRSLDVEPHWKARWLPDPVIAAMQVLKRGGYGPSVGQ